MKRIEKVDMNDMANIRYFVMNLDGDYYIVDRFAFPFSFLLGPFRSTICRFKAAPVCEEIGEKLIKKKKVPVWLYVVYIVVLANQRFIGRCMNNFFSSISYSITFETLLLTIVTFYLLHWIINLILRYSFKRKYQLKFSHILSFKMKEEMSYSERTSKMMLMSVVYLVTHYHLAVLLLNMNEQFISFHEYSTCVCSVIAMLLLSFAGYGPKLHDVYIEQKM